MQHLLSTLLAVIMTVTAYASTAESVTKQDLIKAFRLYREASTYITEIQNDVYSNTSYFEDENIYSPEFTDEQKKLYLKARSLLVKSVELNPYTPEPFMYLGIYSMQVDKDYQKAHDYFSRALEIDPHYEAILSFRFDMSIELKNFDLAKKDLIILKEIGSDYYGTCAETLRNAAP